MLVTQCIPGNQCLPCVIWLGISAAKEKITKREKPKSRTEITEGYELLLEFLPLGNIPPAVSTLRLQARDFGYLLSLKLVELNKGVSSFARN